MLTICSTPSPLGKRSNSLIARRSDSRILHRSILPPCKPSSLSHHAKSARVAGSFFHKTRRKLPGFVGFLTVHSCGGGIAVCSVVGNADGLDCTIELSPPLCKADGRGGNPGPLVRRGLSASSWLFGAFPLFICIRIAPQNTFVPTQGAHTRTAESECLFKRNMQLYEWVIPGSNSVLRAHREGHGYGTALFRPYLRRRPAP